MSASEKRYYKRHYSSAKNLTTELFDFINNQSEYDETNVKENFKDTKLSKNLKVYKVQLADLLLKSLVSYHSKKSIKSKIRQGLEEIEILLDRQLYTQAVSRCKKIREMAQKQEEHEYLLIVLQMEIYLNTFFNDQFNSGKMPQLDKAIQTAESVKELYELRKINFQLSDAHNAMHISQKDNNFQIKAEKLLAGPLANVENTSFHHQYYKNSSKAILQKLAFANPEQEYNFKKENVQLFLDSPHLISENVNTYFAAQYNFLVCCRANGRRNELKAGLLTIRALVDEYPSLKRNLLYVLYLETKTAYLEKNYERIKEKLEPEALKHIGKFKREEENLTALILTYFVLSNLILNHYRQVHFLLRRLFSHSKGLDVNFVKMFDILELVSHLDTKDHQIALKLINSHRRKLRSSRSSSNSFYKFLLEGIHNLIRAEGDLQKREVIHNYFTDWNQFKMDGFYLLAKEFFLLEWKEALHKNASFSAALR